MNPRSTAKKTPATVYLAVSIVIFCLSFSAADSVGFVPCQFDDSCTDASTANSVALSSLPQLGLSATNTPAANTAAVETGILPTHISIPAGDIDLPVQNPTTRDVDTLDSLLKQGPARYVDSASLGEGGNMIIFAHTSHLPSVMIHNKMFQAFNNIPSLKAGDLITITGDDGVQYIYAVDAPAKRATVGDGTTIPLSAGAARKLTLVTCDTLTGVSARFILTATFVAEVGK